MSYDLFLTPKPKSRLPRASLHAFFRNRPNYRLHNNQALYENEDTGVNFSFDLPRGDLGGFSLLRLLRISRPESIAFNLNYFRPHTFGLEAELELTALIKKFNLNIHDPQHEGMADGPYSPEGFLRGWNAGNRFGCHATLKSAPHPVRTLPATKIEEIWNWNFARKERQKEIGSNIFVPVIMLMDSAGVIETVAVWTQAIPILLPPVDSVLLMIDPQNATLAKVPFSELLPLIARFQATYEEAPCYHLDYTKAPPEIHNFFYAKRPAPEDLERLSPGEVLDEELIAMANKLAT